MTFHWQQWHASIFFSNSTSSRICLSSFPSLNVLCQKKWFHWLIIKSYFVHYFAFLSSMKLKSLRYDLCERNAISDSFSCCRYVWKRLNMCGKTYRTVLGNTASERVNILLSICVALVCLSVWQQCYFWQPLFCFKLHFKNVDQSFIWHLKFFI